MKTKTVIFITIILTLLVAYGGMSLYNYGLREKQTAYNEGYTSGLLYTGQSGNIPYIYFNETNNSTEITQITVVQACNNLIQQQGGLK